MLTGFQETPDGTIYVRNAGECYIETRENFEADFGHAVPPLPPEATQRVYEPGKRHALADGSSVVAGGEMPWSFGDAAIAACDKLLAKKAAREVPPPPTEDELRARARAEAVARLYASDVVAVRFQKAGLNYPKEWRNYDALLREIVRNPQVDPAWPVSPNKPDDI